MWFVAISCIALALIFVVRAQLTGSRYSLLATVVFGMIGFGLASVLIAK
jgi:hypothetical protein